MTAARKKYLVFSAAFFGSLIADQVTKIWARGALRGHPPMTVIAGYWDFRYSENPGIAFGLMRNLSFARPLLFVIGMGALVVIFTFLRRARPELWRIAVELGLLAGGAVGNIIDRVSVGRVTDFVLWHVHQYEWPIFNVADAALVVGVIGLLFDAKGDDAMSPAASPKPATKS